MSSEGRAVSIHQDFNLPSFPAPHRLTHRIVTYTTTDARQVRIEQMLVVGGFLDKNKLQLINAYLLSSDGDHTVESGEKAPDGQTATLRFSLPA